MLIEALVPLAPRGVQHDPVSGSAWIDYTVAGQWYQLWFGELAERCATITLVPTHLPRYHTADDGESLALKYALARTHALRGVAFWTADFVNRTTPAGALMWDAVPGH